MVSFGVFCQRFSHHTRQHGGQQLVQLWRTTANNRIDYMRDRHVNNQTLIVSIFQWIILCGLEFKTTEL